MMTARKRAKNSRQRGTHTHGWGSKKKHRGAGNRGGKGMAGTGKRGDAKKPSIWKGKRSYLGKFGFKKKNQKIKINTITIRSVEQKTPEWVSNKIAEEKNGMILIDLEKAGYNKLLSNGKITKKLKIKVPYASNKAVEKVKSAGGEIEVFSDSIPKKEADKKEE